MTDSVTCRLQWTVWKSQSFRLPGRVVPRCTDLGSWRLLASENQQKPSLMNGSSSNAKLVPRPPISWWSPLFRPVSSPGDDDFLYGSKPGRHGRAAPPLASSGVGHRGKPWGYFRCRTCNRPHGWLAGAEVTGDSARFWSVIV